MANISISVTNLATVVKDSDAQSVLAALQAQVHRDFAPIWGVDADLAFVPKSSKMPEGSWWLAIFDNSDQAGALGYHDLTSDGLPLGKVFAETDIKNGYEWSVTASHELLEMLGDPDINLTAFVETSNTGGRLYAYEVCDACEADSDGYHIGPTLVSDFVTPAWFESFRAPSSAQFDFGEKIPRPFALRPGGYIGVYDVPSGGGWHQLTAQGTPSKYDMRPRLGSRRERRRTPRSEWMRSEPR